MSKFKSLRLLLPLCGALLIGAPLAFAQDGAVATDAATADDYKYPAPAKTPEVAGERFYQFLSIGMVRDSQSSGAPFDWKRAEAYLNGISRQQILEMSSHPQSGGPERLFALLAQQKDEPQYEGKIVGKEGDQTFVEVGPAPAKKRAVVVIAEDGGYRVDVKATYGRWNDLNGEKLDMAWADSTGIVSPALAQNTAFLDSKARSSCQSNLKQAMLGILQYSQDYDEKFPPAQKWVDVIMPYVKSEQIFRCPALPAGSNYGYALNQNLGGLSLMKITSPAQTVSIYETNDLTRSAFGVGDERAFRHDGGSNIAFADGHIKWYAKGDEPAEEMKITP